MSFRHLVMISLSLLVIGTVDLDGQYAQSAKEKFGAINQPAYTPDLHFYRLLFQSNRTSSTKAPRKKQRASVRFIRPHFVDWNRFEKKWTKQRYVTQRPASRCYLCLLQKLIGDCIERCLLVRFDRCAISERVSYDVFALIFLSTFDDLYVNWLIFRVCIMYYPGKVEVSCTM